MGGRYGWTPKEPGAELLRKFPWVGSGPVRGGLELESAHGALNDTAWMARALFCVRDPEVLETIPDPFRRLYVETRSPGKRKLDALIKRIETCSYPVEHYTCRWSDEDYQSATRSLGRLVGLEDFGERVRSWLWFAIRADLKLLSPSSGAGLQRADLLAEESQHQERYREACRACHVPRTELLQQLQTYAGSESDSVCLVTGPAGSGKSALLAQLVRNHHLQNPKTIVLSYFVGATPRSTSLREMLGQLCEAIKTRLKLALPIPSGTAERLSVFLGLLLGVPPKHRLLLVLDGLDRLDAEHDAHTLHWLPERLRAHVKIVASCQSDSAQPHPLLTAFQGRKCQTVEVGPLTDEERRQMVRTWPRMPAQSLTPDEIEELLANPTTGNPLYLKVALEELRAGARG